MKGLESFLGTGHEAYLILIKNTALAGFTPGDEVLEQTYFLRTVTSDRRRSKPPAFPKNAECRGSRGNNTFVVVPEEGHLQARRVHHDLRHAANRPIFSVCLLADFSGIQPSAFLSISVLEIPKLDCAIRDIVQSSCVSLYM